MHLIDAYSGSIRCSYRAYNDVDAIEAAQCVAFTNDGQRVFAGFNRCIKIFHTGIPGRDCEILRMGKTTRSRDGQKGIVSSIAFAEGSGSNSRVFSVGTYAGSIYLYDDRAPSGHPAGVVLSNCGLCVVGQGKGFSRKRRYIDTCADAEEKGNDENIFSAAKVKWFQQAVRRGITQLLFSPDGKTLFSASRRSNAVVSWDVRMLSDQSESCVHGLASYEREGDTNQKLQFDLDENGVRLFVACRDDCVKIYDVKSRKIVSSISGLCDAANGVSYCEGQGMLAVSVGARRFEEFDEKNNRKKLPGGAASHVPPGDLELYKVD